MSAILSAALPVLLQVIGWVLDRKNANARTKELFFEFVKKAGNDFGSVRLMEYGDQQLQWLKSQPEWKETT